MIFLFFWQIFNKLEIGPNLKIWQICVSTSKWLVAQEQHGSVLVFGLDPSSEAPVRIRDGRVKYKFSDLPVKIAPPSDSVQETSSSTAQETGIV